MGADECREGADTHYPPLPVPPVSNRAAGRRVCIVTEEVLGPFRNGGIGTTYCAMARLLADAGFDVTLLYTRGRESARGSIDFWIDEYARRGIRLVPLPECSEPLDGAFALRLAYRVFRWLQSETFEVVHFPEYRAVPYYSLLAKRQGTDFSATTFCVGAHSPTLWIKEANHEFAERTDDLEYDALERRCVELADILWSPSQYLLRWMKSRYWKFPRLVYVQPNLIACDVPGRSEVADRIPARELVFFGRLEPRKGIELFCDALDRLDSSLAERNVHVTFLGKPTRIGELEASEFLRERGEDWRFVWNIRSEDSREEALEYLREPGRLAIMPSRLENSPLTVMECIEYQIPFLASAVGGIPELVHPEDRDRVLFRPRVQDLARCIEAELDGFPRTARPTLAMADNRNHWLTWHRSVVPQASADSENGTGAKGRPFVSVCLTHHDRPEYLEFAVESLLDQDYANFEVILIDDGSTSESARAALDRWETVFPSRGWMIVRQENRYLGAARNAAARRARGEYLLFMDDDNVAKPWEISTFVRVAERTSADIVTCLIDMFPGEGRPTPGSLENCRWLIAGLASNLGIVKNCFGDANALIRRASFEALGGFSEDFGVTHEDWELFARASLKGMRLELVPDALFWYRYNESSMIRTTPRLPNFARSLRPFLEHCPVELHEFLRFAQGQALHVQDLYEKIDMLATRLDLMKEHANQLEFQLMRRELHLQQSRYRLADKVNQGLKRLPTAHGLARRLLRGREEW